MCRVDGLLRFGSRSMVRLPKVYGFVTLSRFAIRRSSSDAEVLGALIKAPEFEGPGYDLPTPTAEQVQEWEAFRARLMDRLTQGGQASIPPVDRRPRHGPLLVSGSVSALTRSRRQTTPDRSCANGPANMETRLPRYPHSSSLRSTPPWMRL